MYEINTPSPPTYPSPPFSFSNIWGNGYTSGSTSNININLPSLADILSNNSPTNNLNFTHSEPLGQYQCMWCNGAFRGPFSASITNSIENPYIDYTSFANINHTFSTLV